MVWTAPYGIDCARMRLSRSHTREPSVSEIIRIGMDTSKYIFVLHGVDAEERTVLRKRLSRKGMLEFFAKLPPPVGGVGGLWGFALLGARAGKAGPRGETDCAAVGEAVCRAQQERRPRCRGSVRGGEPAREA